MLSSILFWAVTNSGAVAAFVPVAGSVATRQNYKEDLSGL
jgi:hypothetical protein